mmetsp:Transcript_3385/g.6141  ORF Transcript_3385/g.6141 Transcript_3385/m.6141 type:complete len:133 (+) Transcript_3385:133-531(+)
MALHFVSTSTTTSSDGISFDTEEVKESQEIIQARRAADIASKKSLFEQLSDQQEKKKEEYDKNTKLIFGMSSCQLLQQPLHDVPYMTEVTVCDLSQYLSLRWFCSCCQLPRNASTKKMWSTFPKWMSDTSFS